MVLNFVMQCDIFDRQQRNVNFELRTGGAMFGFVKERRLEHFGVESCVKGYHVYNGVQLVKSSQNRTSLVQILACAKIYTRDVLSTDVMCRQRCSVGGTLCGWKIS